MVTRLFPYRSGKRKSVAICARDNTEIQIGAGRPQSEIDRYSGKVVLAEGRLAVEHLLKTPEIWALDSIQSINPEQQSHLPYLVVLPEIPASD